MNLLRILWVLPNTLIGLGLGICAGGKVSIRAGIVEFYAIPRICVFPAMAMGHVILYKDESTAALWRMHELVHVRQYEKFGPFFLPAFVTCALVLWILGLDPYMDNPFELQAYREAKGPYGLFGRSRESER